MKGSKSKFYFLSIDGASALATLFKTPIIFIRNFGVMPEMIFDILIEH